MRRILDASVIFKWFVDEVGSETAREYLQVFLEGEDKILIPTLLFYELGNVCKKRSLPVHDVSKVMELFQRLPFEKEDIGFTSFRKIYQNASEYNLSFYDASYVTLMQKNNCELVTADKALYNKLKTAFSHIKLL